jgi:CheY-like chemotaxis protein
MIPDEDLHRHEERRPDVVVLDVEMPVIGAQAVMRRMSRLDPTSEARRA